MPIARLPADPGAPVVTPQDVKVPDGGPTIPAGSAVAQVWVGGEKVYALCGALPGNSPNGFFGFAASSGLAGLKMAVTTGRGSKVAPLVKDDLPLTPEQDVYLSDVPGRVTQTLLFQEGITHLRVGRATSPTDMVLVTDSRFGIGG
jgi:hypothetical protein